MGNTPSATTPGNPPTGTAGGTGLCCACPVEGLASTNGYGAYFLTNYPHSTVLWNDCYLNFIRTSSAGRVEVTVKVALKYQEGASAVNHGDYAADLVRYAQTFWNRGARGYKLKIKQDGCPEQELAMQLNFEIVVSAAEADVEIYISDLPMAPGNDNISYVEGGYLMVFYLNGVGDPYWVMAHEFGHVLGQPDEYVELEVTAQPSGNGVNYIPDGPAPVVTFIGTATQENASGGKGQTAVNLEPGFPTPGEPTYTFNTNSAMGMDGGQRIYAENFFWVAIESEKLFAAEGTSISANIILS